MAKRSSITKKIRFEVFKRDSFKCQYCGKSSPDAVLEIDHIKPVIEGGTNDLTNLITACFDCNRGKSRTLIDDNSMLEKQRKQLEELNERRNQLEMMMKWREGLVSIEQDTLKILIDKFEELACCEVTDQGKKKIKSLLKKYDLNLILDCIEISTTQYLIPSDDGFTSESRNKAFNYIGRICNVKSNEEEVPKYYKELHYIKGILRNRLNYFDEKKGFQLLKQAYETGASIQGLKDLALSVKHWTEFRSTIEEFLEGADNDL